jgi:hypothetical protein
MAKLETATHASATFDRTADALYFDSLVRCDFTPHGSPGGVRQHSQKNFVQNFVASRRNFAY